MSKTISAEAAISMIQRRLDEWEVDDTTGEKLVNDLDNILEMVGK